MSAVRWLAEHVEDGRVAFRIGRAGDELVAEWVGLARVTASRDGKTHRFEPEPGLEPAEIEKVRLGSANLLLRHLQGKLALHGAAVEVRERALVLLGRSGQGKSTLAASLCARAGATLFSDDAVAIDAGPTPGTYVLSPVERNHWLDAPARQALLEAQGSRADAGDDDSKRPVAAPRVGAESAPLVAIVDLAFGDDETPRLIAVGRGIDAIAALVPQAVRFVVDEPELQRRELEALAELVDGVPVYRLVRPRRLEQLERAHPLLLDLLGSERKSGHR
ncbi:hypothetical protein BH11MYX4_BH11MYX4_42330 [soil metagenome]